MDQPASSPAVSAAFAGSPQEMYRQMRETMPPVTEVRGPTGPLAVVTRRRDIDEAFRHPEIFASTEAVDLQNVRPLIPLNVDPPEHRKYRRILDPIFAPRALAGLEGRITQLANELMDAFGGQEVIDFAASFSVPLPSHVFLTMFGLPVEELETFLAMKDGIIRPQDVVRKPPGHPDAIAHQKKTAMSIYDYFEPLLDERASEPRDDIITRFLSSEIDGEKLTRENILDICFLFLIAGLDTVTASLDCMFAFLATHADHRRRIVEDPSIIPAAVEELLRYETPVVAVPRITTCDTELGGCPIPSGRFVTLLIGSGNTDDEEFGDGDAVRFDRDPNRHQAFGGGIHRCLGSHLARLELRVALREWHRRYPDYSIPPGEQLSYSVGIRSIDRFPMRLAA